MLRHLFEGFVVREFCRMYTSIMEMDIVGLCDHANCVSHFIVYLVYINSVLLCLCVCTVLLACD